MGDIMSKQEALDVLKEMAKPFNLDELVTNGVLKKSGAWYSILKPDVLPAHVMKHTSALQQTAKGETLFKFQKDWKKAARFYKTISGQQLPEEASGE